MIAQFQKVDIKIDVIIEISMIATIQTNIVIFLLITTLQHHR